MELDALRTPEVRSGDRVRAGPRRSLRRAPHRRAARADCPRTGGRTKPRTRSAPRPRPHERTSRRTLPPETLRRDGAPMPHWRRRAQRRGARGARASPTCRVPSSCRANYRLRVGTATAGRRASCRGPSGGVLRQGCPSPRLASTTDAALCSWCSSRRDPWRWSPKSSGFGSSASSSAAAHTPRRRHSPCFSPDSRGQRLFWPSRDGVFASLRLYAGLELAIRVRGAPVLRATGRASLRPSPALGDSLGRTGGALLVGRLVLAFGLLLPTSFFLGGTLRRASHDGS